MSNAGRAVLTEADDRGQAGQAGVADALRDGKAGDGDSGDEVGLEEVEGVAGGPLEDGDEVLQGEDEGSGGWLVLELLEGVVGEEGFLEGGFEGLEEGFFGRNLDFHSYSLLD